jgi:ADP-heptose:LPS heptosyltransferase
MNARMNIVVSPFSNSLVRDWPSASYVALIELLLEALPSEAVIRVMGTQSQALRADEIVRSLNAKRVFNDCGRYDWPVVEAVLCRASCVIGNNSGIAHLAAHHGIPTVCIFGGSHQRAEWRPLGPNVTIISRAIWCSPCHLDRLAQCSLDKACLRNIEPAVVAAAVVAALARQQDMPQERIAGHP